ncbi:helicase [Malassezia vespertilionis]|uniref:helicase n=1 Tax=Malassezia vespertilionis TaxID=2020962 RepID=UPI0024B27407|nr:helicase [Malassezia vespertilionis]WFD08181.1 helicase [Malassezia vespertilionis]
MATFQSEQAQGKLLSRFHMPSKRKVPGESSAPPQPAPEAPPAPLAPPTHEPSYLCQWRTPSMRKHKTWEGDAVLVLHGNGTTCSLRSVHDGKLLVTNAAFRRPGVRDGDELYVGGKEILIERSMDPVAEQEDAPKHVAVKRVCRGATPVSQFYAPAQKPSDAPLARRMVQEPHARYDANAPGAIVMTRPNEEHRALYGRGMPVVDVVLEPALTRVLRPHQIDGVRFLYEAAMGITSLKQGDALRGQGAILADEMGLGKTLQTITLIVTLLRQNCYFSSVTAGTIEKALVVCPLTLVMNWKREFRKWIGRSSIGVLAVEGDGRNEVERFVSGRQYQVLIIGYERLRSCAKQLAKTTPPIGLVVCDEGHRLKSKDTKTAKCFDLFKTSRRILLTGTPIQNDLREFYTMVDFVYPGMFDQYSVFKRVFEDPIMRSRMPHGSPEAAALGRARSHALQLVTKGIILRRTAEILSNYLPPKHEMVLFCTPSTVQRKIYGMFSEFVNHQLVFGEERNYLPYITLMRQLCNSPEYLRASLTDPPSDSATQPLLQAGETLLRTASSGHDLNMRLVRESGKLSALHALLTAIRKETNDRVIVVSNFTATLDLLQTYCNAQKFPTLRLDGKTKQEMRTKLVNRFNRTSEESSEQDPFVFLLSSKSGGVGLNLIGANRLVLFDSDWNPSTDKQAMARIHRDGQMKPCFIYRLLLVGTMDEKIYQRQLTKIGLSDALMGTEAQSAQESAAARDSFSLEEIKDIFTLHTNTQCLSHDQLRCSCGGEGTDPHKHIEMEEDQAEIPHSTRPGFVRASVLQQETRFEKDKRRKLAMQLGDMRHYDFRRRHDALSHDPTLQQIGTIQHTEWSAAGTPCQEDEASTTLVPHAADTPILPRLVEKYTKLGEHGELQGGLISYVFLKGPGIVSEQAEAASDVEV